MAERDFSIYDGKFPCKKCNEEVFSLRLWSASGDATWMCSQKHISKVSLMPPKKRKKDYINE